MITRSGMTTLPLLTALTDGCRRIRLGQFPIPEHWSSLGAGRESARYSGRAGSAFTTAAPAMHRCALFDSDIRAAGPLESSIGRCAWLRFQVTVKFEIKFYLEPSAYESDIRSSINRYERIGN
jgi:hypothetical protein